MFAVFVTSTRCRLPPFQREWDAIIRKVIIRLVSGIPDKIKFFMMRLIPVRDLDSPEILGVLDPYGGYFHLERLMLDILNKRWQTLDLISMMEELNRSVNEKLNRSEWYSPSWQNLRAISVTDRLSSRPRFKKEEDLTDCA